MFFCYNSMSSQIRLCLFLNHLQMGCLWPVCLWSHNHLTSIRFSSGDLVGRNTNCILGRYLARFSFTLFDLCIDMLSSTKNICLILLLAKFPESLPLLIFYQTIQRVSSIIGNQPGSLTLKCRYSKNVSIGLSV